MEKEKRINEIIELERANLKQEQEKLINQIKKDIEACLTKSNEEIIEDYKKMLDIIITRQSKLETFTKMGTPLVRPNEKSLKKSEEKKNKWIEEKKAIQAGENYPKELQDKLNFKNMSQEQITEYIQQKLEIKKLSDKQIEEQLNQKRIKLEEKSNKKGLLERLKKIIEGLNETTTNNDENTKNPKSR